VLDLGCGDGDLLVRLVSEPQIDRIVGVDLSRDRLDRLRARLAALGENSARRVDLVHGSMTEGGAALAGFDCALLVETIEHIEPDRLSVLERSVFGAMRPATVVITTPNADFNPLLGVPTDRFRHPDHRFEWGRAKFRRWADGVAERNRYHVVCSDLAGCLKISKLGGLTRTRQLRDLCAASGIAMTLEDSWGGDITTAAIAHLAHSTPEALRFTSTDFNSYVTVSTAAGAPQCRNGVMLASEAPGLGVTPRPDVLGAVVVDVQ
jgi:hypothetical protein